MREIQDREVCRVERQVSKVVCDLCGRVGTGGSYCGEESFWGENVFDTQETSLYLKKGANFPEFRDGTVQYVDICPTCMEQKVFPWLQEQKVEIQEYSYDY